MTSANKDFIKTRFRKNTKTYQSEATVQKYISTFLVEKIAALLNKDYKNILEIGCGTGFLTKEICSRIPHTSLYLNDVYREAYETSLLYANKLGSTHSHFIEGDAETSHFPSNLDGIFSASCFQWFNNLGLFISKAHKLLNKNGVLAFSTFGEHHFSEIKRTTGHGLNYYSLLEIEALIGNKFKILYIHEWMREKKFTSPKEVLKHIKFTGLTA